MIGHSAGAKQYLCKIVNVSSDGTRHEPRRSCAVKLGVMVETDASADLCSGLSVFDRIYAGVCRSVRVLFDCHMATQTTSHGLICTCSLVPSSNKAI